MPYYKVVPKMICLSAYQQLGSPASPHISVHEDDLESQESQPSELFSRSHYFHNCLHCSGVCNVINNRRWRIIRLMLFICWQIA